MVYSLFIFFIIILLLGIYAPKRIYEEAGESSAKLRQEIEDLSFDLKRLKSSHEQEPDEEIAREQHRRMCEIQRRIDNLKNLIDE